LREREPSAWIDAGAYAAMAQARNPFGDGQAKGGRPEPPSVEFLAERTTMS